MKRLSSAISLYVPNELSTSYNAEWGEEDMLNLDLIARGIDPFTSNAPVGMVDRLKKLGEVAKDYGTSKVLGGSSYIEKATRTTPGQSKMEQLFRRVNFRDFSFMYQFAPRDEYEADNSCVHPCTAVNSITLRLKIIFIVSLIVRHSRCRSSG